MKRCPSTLVMNAVLCTEKADTIQSKKLNLCPVHMQLYHYFNLEYDPLYYRLIGTIFDCIATSPCNTYYGEGFYARSGSKVPITKRSWLGRVLCYCMFSDVFSRYVHVVVVQHQHYYYYPTMLLAHYFQIIASCSPRPLPTAIQSSPIRTFFKIVALP